MAYLAVVLDKKSSEALESHMPDWYYTRDQWKTYCHHMTICMGSNSKGKYNWEVGEKVSLLVVSIGFDHRVCAAMVRLPEGKRIKNKIPHVTMAVNTKNGGKPVMSNRIREWAGPVRDANNKDLMITGVVTLCD